MNPNDTIAPIPVAAEMPPKRDTWPVSVEVELEALNSAVKALDRLDPDARARAMRYLTDRYGDGQP